MTPTEMERLKGYLDYLFGNVENGSITSCSDQLFTKLNDVDE